MVRRELDPARMLDATAEALMPALALSGLSIHTLADGALGRPLTEAGKPAHTDLLAALVKRLEGDRQAVELHDAAGDLLVRATLSPDRPNGLVCAWPVSGRRGWPGNRRASCRETVSQYGLTQWVPGSL